MRVELKVPSSDGTEIYASSEGSGPTLVLCDGLGCDGFIWPAAWFLVKYWNWWSGGGKVSWLLDRRCDRVEGVVGVVEIDGLQWVLTVGVKWTAVIRELLSLLC